MLRLGSIGRQATGLALLALLALATPCRARAAADAAEGHRRCGSCHWTERSEGATAGPAAACSGCHEQVLLEARAGFGSSHLALGCAACHALHAGAASPAAVEVKRGAPDPPGYQLDTVSRSCAACHLGTRPVRGPGGHALRHPVGVTLPPSARASNPFPLADVRGTDDPADDVIACTTCHEPHASPHPFLLRWGAQSEREACAGCHSVESPAQPSRADRS